MSDNIPVDIQREIVKRVSSVKSVIQFRSVSKQWKSFIDSSEFIKGYGARHTHPHSHILSIISDNDYRGKEPKYIHLVDDDMETFKVQQPPFVVSHLLKRCHIRSDFGGVIGSSYGLSCLFAYNLDIDKRGYMLVIWNPSIGKSFGIALPDFMALDCSGKYSIGYGFGVCPVTSDPTIVEFVCARDMPSWHVRVFTLSSRVWNVIPSDKLPHQTISFCKYTQVVIDKFIYWAAWESYNSDQMVLSFDLITHEFKVVNLPDALKKLSVNYRGSLSLSELRGSLVVCEYKSLAEAEEADVWVMGNDSSFRKLFNIRAPRINQILGFKENGETVFISRSYAWERTSSVLHVYDPCSQQIKNLGISGEYDSFFMGAYKESLLLLDHLDSHIYQDNSDDQDDEDNI